MKNTIKTYSHEQNWTVCNTLEKLGYLKYFDCMWSKGYRKDDEVVIVELELNY